MTLPTAGPTKNRFIAGRAALLVAVMFTGVLALLPSFEVARAACTGSESEDIPYPTGVQPAPQGFQVQGAAPLVVVMAINESAVLSPPLTSSLDWGDGSGTSPLTIVPCGDDIYSFPAQQRSHTYATPGDYFVLWNINAEFLQPISAMVLMVHVDAAVATPPPATPTPAPPAPGATPTPLAPTPTSGATAPAVTTTTEPSPGASESPTPSAAPSTPTATPSPTATATSTPTPHVAVSTAPPGTPDPPIYDRPEILRDLPDVTDISTDAGVVSTNLVLAGLTVWVFFSSVLFNQTMQEHREELTGWIRRLRARKKVGWGWLRRLKLGRTGEIAAVLVATGIIYGLLEPEFGPNRASAVLFASVVIGVGVIGLLYSSLEAWSRHRTLGLSVQVRTFPLSLVIGLACVGISRLLDLHPGVIYGFAASCVVIGEAPVVAKHSEGRALALPVIVSLSLSVVAWLLVAPLRELPFAAISDVLEGVAVIVFIGGLEGLLVNLLPLDVMDGAKIYRWDRRIWALLALVTAFLFWHVLLNSQRAYFDSLREASSLSVLGAFAAYSAAGIGLWMFFRQRTRRLRLAPLPSEPRA